MPRNKELSPCGQHRGLFLSWTRENGRTRDLAHSLDLRAVHIYPNGTVPARYVKSMFMTWKVLWRNRARAIVVMLPPTPLLLAVAVARPFLARPPVYDLHTGFFYDPKWQWARSFSLRLMRRSTAIVTNANLARVCASQGVPSLVLHDPLVDSRDAAQTPTTDRHSIVCPVSYANDEPIVELLAAAKATPDITWVLTGRAPTEIRDSAPNNIIFSGFLSDAEYAAELGRSSAVLALTTRKDTMQRAGYEALMLGKPVITSDFEVLREFFGDSAVYTDNTESSISEAAERAIRNLHPLSAQASRTLKKRIEEQRDAVVNVRRLLSHS